jgi:hypothetical protein
MKLDTNHAWVKGFPNCSYKGSGLRLRGDNHTNIKIRYFSPEPLRQNRSYIHEKFLI